MFCLQKIQFIDIKGLPSRERTYTIKSHFKSFSFSAGGICYMLVPWRVFPLKPATQKWWHLLSMFTRSSFIPWSRRFWNFQKMSLLSFHNPLKNMLAKNWIISPIFGMLISTQPHGQLPGPSFDVLLVVVFFANDDVQVMQAVTFLPDRWRSRFQLWMGHVNSPSQKGHDGRIGRLPGCPAGT